MTRVRILQAIQSGQASPPSANSAQFLQMAWKQTSEFNSTKGQLTATHGDGFYFTLPLLKQEGKKL